MRKSVNKKLCTSLGPMRFCVDVYTMLRNIILQETKEGFQLRNKDLGRAPTIGFKYQIIQIMKKLDNHKKNKHRNAIVCLNNKAIKQTIA